MSLKGFLRRGIRRTGFDVVRVRPPVAGTLSALELAMSAVLAAQGHLRVVQVGANDGIHNDPLHRFLTAHRGTVGCLFVEPQAQPLQVLRAHYADAPGFGYAQAAVGPSGSLRLYTVARSAWSQLTMPYAGDDWPDYRGPTGITSADRGHVHAWLTRHYSGEQPLDSLIEAHDVRSAPLDTLLAEQGWQDGPDVLQVDTEGFDDEVLYASSVDTHRPALINYEHVHLPAARRRGCEEFLTGLDYRLTNTGNDTLAVLW